MAMKLFLLCAVILVSFQAAAGQSNTTNNVHVRTDQLNGNPTPTNAKNSCDGRCVIIVVACVLSVFVLCLVGSVYYATHQNKDQIVWNRKPRNADKKHELRNSSSLNEFDGRFEHPVLSVDNFGYDLDVRGDGINYPVGRVQYDGENGYLPPNNSYLYADSYNELPPSLYEVRKNRLQSVSDLYEAEQTHDSGSRAYSLDDDRLRFPDERIRDCYGSNTSFPNLPDHLGRSQSLGSDTYFVDRYGNEHAAAIDYDVEECHTINQQYSGEKHKQPHHQSSDAEKHTTRYPSADIEIANSQHTSNSLNIKCEKKQLSSPLPSKHERNDKRVPTPRANKPPLKHSKGFEEIPVVNIETNVNIEKVDDNARMSPTSSKYQARSRSLDMIDNEDDQSDIYMTECYESEISAYNQDDEEAYDEKISELGNTTNIVIETGQNKDLFQENDDNNNIPIENTDGIEIKVLDEREFNKSGVHSANKLMEQMSKSKVFERRLDDY